MEPSRRRVRRARAHAHAWAVLGVVAVLLAACTGSPEEPPTPSPTATPAPTPTPTPTPSRSTAPDRPAELDRDDLAGAEAAAQYFLELYPYAHNTGDLGDFGRMSLPECVFCAGVIERVDGMRGRGEYEVGGRVLVEDVTASEPLEGNEYHRVDLVVLQGGSTVYDAAGDVVRTTEPGRYRMLMALLLRDGEWFVREVTPEEIE